MSLIYLKFTIFLGFVLKISKLLASPPPTPSREIGKWSIFASLDSVFKIIEYVIY